MTRPSARRSTTWNANNPCHVDHSKRNEHNHPGCARLLPADSPAAFIYLGRIPPFISASNTNGTRRVETVRLGMIQDRDTGTTGPYFFDGFESRRISFIGYAPDRIRGEQSAFKADFKPINETGRGSPANGDLPAPLTEISGTVQVTTTIGYIYDPLGRLIGARYSDGRFFQYTYDSVGNRLTVSTATGTITNTYDIANRMATSGAQTYNWDAAGNLLSDGVFTYTFDTAQRLISQTGPGTSSTFVYNGLNERVQQTVDGATTQFVVDLGGSINQVLADNTATYLYGLDRIGERQTSQWLYHLDDPLGSVRMGTNGSGTVTLSATYDPYGSVLATAGTATSAYGFAGERRNGDLLYLRSRYYAPAMGRFVSRDAWVGDPMSPIGYNKWLYANANPVNLTDPTGYCALCGVRGYAWVGNNPEGGSANIRNMPHASGSIIGQARVGMKVTVYPGLIFNSGRFWRRIDIPGGGMPGALNRLYISNKFLVDHEPPRVPSPGGSGGAPISLPGGGTFMFTESPVLSDGGRLGAFGANRYACTWCNASAKEYAPPCWYDDLRGLHNGLDISAKLGAIVKFTGNQEGVLEDFTTIPWTGDGGPNVRVRAGSYVVNFAHMDPSPAILAATPKETVIPIDMPLGTIWDWPNSNNEHLHVGVRQGSWHYNPVYFFPDEVIKSLPDFQPMAPEGTLNTETPYSMLGFNAVDGGWFWPDPKVPGSTGDQSVGIMRP